MLGNICLYRLPVPRTIALAVGAAAESCVVFLLLLGGVGNRVSFALLGALCLGLYLWLRRGAVRLADPVNAPADRVSAWLAGGALALYGALYLINALAPELEPDAIAYHLGLTSEYVRLGGFPNRVGFYEMLPQGFEMLFVPAFAFGRHSAARLVHFAFLLASVPLMWRIGRRLQLPDSVALAAAVLYFCAPLAGITGTSAYTDAGGVFFVLATFYLLLVWRDTRDVRYLAPAGIAAGFCYAIKFPGAMVVILAVAFVLLSQPRRRVVQPLALLTVAALAMMAPWIVRDFIITGNPVAPLFNQFFPNPYFHLATEKQLTAELASFGGLPPWRVVYEMIVGGAFQGTLGPVFFALPLALLALRRRAGRLCWLAAACLALPWFWNTGARFLMPALPFLALALVMALPRPAVWGCMVLQAVACWPQIMGLYHPAYTWRLERVPWRAALRIEPDQNYLGRLINEYQTARMIEDRTRPGERVFALIAVATAYTDREVLGAWQSAQADDLTDALGVALTKGPVIDVKAEWPSSALSGVRIRVPQAAPVEWQIHDILLFSGEAPIASNPPWQLSGWPNEWELPLAFDGNRATRWRTWEPIRAGMYVEADFGHPLVLSGALMTSADPLPSVPFEFYGREGDGWHLLSSRPVATERPMGDVRMEATQALLRAGFRYILAYNGEGAKGAIGSAMAGHEAEWGLQKAGETGPVLLFRIE